MYNNNYKNWSNLRNDIEEVVHKIPKLEYGKQYLTIEAITAGTVTIYYDEIDGSAKTISYSTNNGSTWTSITTTTSQVSLKTLAVGEKILFKGTNTVYNCGLIFNGTAQTKVYGNIMSLIYGDNFIGQTTLDSAGDNFNSLFWDYTNLISAENLVLPTTTLTVNCYNAMFAGCTSLTKAPELLVTTLATYCYSYIFSGCTSLTKAPELPATILADGCYNSMFNGCTSLTKAPTLPATTLVYNCYNDMFYGCTSLTKAPTLPATTLAESCYQNMFNSCTLLTTAPELPATTLADYCYADMFYNCTSLTNAPELPATTLANNCYQGMFYGCTSLTKAPDLPATTLANSCYSNIFWGCTSLKEAPELPATTLVSGCYTSMFRGCTKLNYIKALFTTTPSNSYTQYWVTNVASTGTFIKSDSATWTTTGTNAVPTSWTVYKESQEPYNIQHDSVTANSNTLLSKAGTYTFHGSGYIQSGYDYVGMQIGDSVDKLQFANFYESNSHYLKWRQNDSGGTNTSWDSWKTFIDTNNLSNFSYPKSNDITMYDSSGSIYFGFADSGYFNMIDLNESINESDYPYCTNYQSSGMFTYYDGSNNNPLIINSDIILQNLNSGNYLGITASAFYLYDSSGNQYELGIAEIKEENLTDPLVTDNTFIVERNKNIILRGFTPHISVETINNTAITIKLDEPNTTSYQNVYTFCFKTGSSVSSTSISFKDSSNNTININWFGSQSSIFLTTNSYYEFSIRYNRFETNNNLKYFGTYIKYNI